MIMQEFGFESIPLNQIGLCLAHVLRKWKFRVRIEKASKDMVAKVLNEAESGGTRGKGAKLTYFFPSERFSNRDQQRKNFPTFLVAPPFLLFLGEWLFSN